MLFLFTHTEHTLERKRKKENGSSFLENSIEALLSRLCACDKKHRNILSAKKRGERINPEFFNYKKIVVVVESLVYVLRLAHDTSLPEVYTVCVYECACNKRKEEAK